METNPTIVFRAPKKVEIEERTIPRPGEGEVLIKTICTVISTGTELSILNAEYPPGSYWAEYGKLPFDPGYDNIGTVIDVGAGVDRALVGTKVGTYGNHARYVVQPASTIRPIHRDIPDEEAVFFTLGEICMNAVRRPRVLWGESVVIYGMGLLGHITAQLCRIAGARPVFAVDVAPSRLTQLPKDPALIPIDASMQNVVDLVKRETRGRMADVVFEVTGDPDLIVREFEVLHKQGRMVILGCPRGKTTIDLHDLCNMPSHSIIGVHNMSHPPVATLDNPWTNLRDAELFFDLVADGELLIKPLITHREHYSRAVELYDLLMKDRSKAMGVVLTWS